MRQAGRRFVARLAHLAATPSRRLSMKVALAIVGVAALVLVSAGSVSVWLFRDAQLRSLTALHVLEASMAADRIERFIDDLDRRMAELVALPWSSTSDDDRRIDTLRTLRALAPVHTLRLIDPQGREQVRVARLGADIAGSGADFSGNADYLAAARTGRHTGRVYFQDGSEPYVTLALRGPSTRQGGVVADVNLKLIWDIVAATRIGQAGRMLLVDGDGRLISHTDIGQALRRADVTQLPQVRAALTPSLAAREERLVPGLNLDGLPILSAHARLTSLGWSVVTELPRAEVMVPIASIVQLAGLALVGGFAAAVLCGIVVARSVVRPIEVLTAGATRIGSGSLDHRIAINGSDEFAELGSRFNEMAARLQAERATLEDKVSLRTQELARANRAKSRFLASASHDLRQPLHAVSLFVDELHAQPSRKRQQHLYAKLTEAVSSLNGMFEAILDTSKIEADAITASVTQFALGPLLDDLREVLAPVAAARRLTLHVGISDLWVESDRLLLARILQNLLANAVRYTHQGHVSLLCRADDEATVIEVSDTGPGIPSDMQGEIFGEFFRAATPGQSGERGLGLGLFIVASFARLLDHPLTLQSAPGCGTTFTLRVPIAPARIMACPADDLRQRVFFGLRRHAAVVGRDPVTRNETAKLLRSWGFDVERAVLPEMLQRGNPDLLVAECDEAGAEGAMGAIANLQHAYASTAIVLVTAQPGLLERVGAGPGFEVLRKPVAPVLLRAVVSRMVR